MWKAVQHPKKVQSIRWAGWTGFLFALLFSLSEGSGEAPSPDFDMLVLQIQTPESLADYMGRNFSFQEDSTLFQQEDYWQTPEEMFLRKKGDCEDYALFAEAILSRTRYPAFIFSVFGEKEAHTVTVFGEEGKWGVFDIDQFRFSKARSLTELAGEIQPDWSYSALMHRSGNSGIILRKFKKA